MALLWPALWAESASELASAAAREYVNFAIGPGREADVPEPQWSTRNRVALELPSVRLRDFSTGGDGVPTLICAPFALHGSTITDFAPRHSLVAALQGAAIKRLFVTDWRSASPEMRFLSIDNYLTELNVSGGRARRHGAPHRAVPRGVDGVGLCRALPRQSRQAGARRSSDRHCSRQARGCTDLARDTPIAIFKELVELGGGRILGRHALQFWAPNMPDRETIRELLQSSAATSSSTFRRLESRFRDWYAWTLDLPGTYYLQAVEYLFKDNRLATGRFVALGREVDLSNLRCPLFLLAARDDEVVAPEQIFATEGLVNSRRCAIQKMIAPGSHLALFMGKDTLRDAWSEIAQWVSS